MKQVKRIIILFLFLLLPSTPLLAEEYKGVSVLSMDGYVTILDLQKKGYVYIKI